MSSKRSKLLKAIHIKYCNTMWRKRTSEKRFFIHWYTKNVLKNEQSTWVNNWHPVSTSVEPWNWFHFDTYTFSQTIVFICWFLLNNCFTDTYLLKFYTTVNIPYAYTIRVRRTLLYEMKIWKFLVDFIILLH